MEVIKYSYQGNKNKKRRKIDENEDVRNSQFYNWWCNEVLLSRRRNYYRFNLTFD